VPIVHDPVSSPLGAWTNYAANYAGTGTAALLGLALAPVYLRLLGAEGYGLVGFYLSISVLCSVLDLGLGTTVNRQLAGLKTDGSVPSTAGELLRSVEVVYWTIAVALGVAVWLTAGWIAKHWFDARTVPTQSVQQAVQWMAVAIAAQWPTQLYAATLLGLQRHLPLNLLRVTFAVVQAIGAVWVLSTVSASPWVYFAWQAASGAALTAALAFVAWRSLGPAPGLRSVRLSRLGAHGRFAAGLTGITATSIALTQVDKLIISRTLPLESLGHYTLAGLVSAGISYLAIPIAATLFPRLASATGPGDTARLGAAYHLGCQLMALVLIPAACCIVAFADSLLRLWLADESVAAEATPIVRLLVTGTMLNGLTALAYNLQLAHGWTRLSLGKNLVAIATVIPMMLWMIPAYGPKGAAAVWVALNLGYLLMEIPLMHRRLLRGHAKRWYLADVLAPLVTVVVVAALSRALMPRELAVGPEIAWIAGTYLVAVTAALAALPELRRAYFPQASRVPRTDTDIGAGRRGTDGGPWLK
jgi:O-antigen/teichoic acid export membrane protein